MFDIRANEEWLRKLRLCKGNGRRSADGSLGCPHAFEIVLSDKIESRGQKGLLEYSG